LMIYRSKNLNTLFIYHRKALKKRKTPGQNPGPYGFNMERMRLLPRYTSRNDILHMGLMNKAPTPRNDILFCHCEPEMGKAILCREQSAATSQIS